MTSISCEIIKSGSYSERFTLKPIAAMPGQIELRVTSQFTTAKDPDGTQVRYQTTLDRAALLRIRQTIDTLLE